MLSNVLIPGCRTVQTPAQYRAGHSNVVAPFARAVSSARRPNTCCAVMTLSAPPSQERNRPIEEHRQPVLEAGQAHETNKKPGHPRGESGKAYLAEHGNRPQARDGCHRPDIGGNGRVAASRHPRADEWSSARRGRRTGPQPVKPPAGCRDTPKLRRDDSLSPVVRNGPSTGTQAILASTSSRPRGVRFAVDSLRARRWRWACPNTPGRWQGRYSALSGVAARFVPGSSPKCWRPRSCFSLARGASAWWAWSRREWQSPRLPQAQGFHTKVVDCHR